MINWKLIVESEGGGIYYDRDILTPPQPSFRPKSFFLPSTSWEVVNYVSVWIYFDPYCDVEGSPEIPISESLFHGCEEFC